MANKGKVLGYIKLSLFLLLLLISWEVSFGILVSSDGIKGTKDLNVRKKTAFDSFNLQPFEISLRFDGLQEFSLHVYPQWLADIDTYVLGIVKNIYGEEQYNRIKNPELIINQVTLHLIERIEFMHDPREDIDKLLPNRRDILFSINVTYPTNNKVAFSHHRQYEYDFRTLNFFSNDSMDYAWKRFLNFNYNTYSYQRTARHARQSVLRKMHRNLLIDQSKKCRYDNKECQINHCKKHLPTFNGYELTLITPQMHRIKKSRVVAAAVQFNIDTCIETGTYKGDTTLFLANSGACERVFTIELDKKMYEKAKQRFQKEIDNGNENAKRITALHGDSGDILHNHDVFKTINDKNVLYFLDGHYSYLDTARGIEDSPVLKELDFIFNQNNDHGVSIILIDDAREFRGSRFREGEVESNDLDKDEVMNYPELANMLAKVCEYDPTSFIDLEDDLLFISTNTFYNVV